MSRRSLLCGVAALGIVGVGCLPDIGSADSVVVSGVAPVDAEEPTEVETVATRHVYGDAPQQFGWLGVPAGRTRSDAIFVLIHGGFWSEPWDYTLMMPMAEALNELGFITWNIEFRRVGGGGGYPATFDDVAAAIDHLATLAEDHEFGIEHIVLVGHSSGGHLALWAAGPTRRGITVAGAIGIAAVTDLERTAPAREFLGGTIGQEPDRYEFAQPVFDPARMLLVHGGLDLIVPVGSLALAERAGIMPTIIAGADHFEVIDPSSSAWPSVVEALQAGATTFRFEV